MATRDITAKLRRRAEKTLRSVQNALEVARIGRLSPERTTAYTVVRDDGMYTLRRYAAQPTTPKLVSPVLLVPSLVVSADVYDIEPESSVVAYLSRAGVDTFLCDFGSQADKHDGRARTHDDHVRAIDACIETVRTLAGRDVHLVGYSQGGMLVYQVAALRRSEGIRSIVTVGTVVDLYATVSVDRDLLGKSLQLSRSGILLALQKLDAIPRTFSSVVFNVLSADKRARQLVRWIRPLRARDRAEKDEAERHFLWGRGLLPFSGPTASKLADDLLVGNRLLHGGFIVDGRACSLSDLTCPILYFFGERDDFARPKAVRAISTAAAKVNELYEIAVPTGHIGLLFGPKAFDTVWPSLVEWLRWREGAGPKPRELVGQDQKPFVSEAIDELQDGLELLRGAGSGMVQTAVEAIARAARTSLKLSESLRWQVARLAKLERLTAQTHVSFGLALEQKAQKQPDGAFFIYDGRGQSYADANRRVDNVVKGLITCGVRPHQQVGVLMNNRPSYMSLVCALSRLGAVAVLLSPDSQRASLEHALALAPVDVIVADPDNVEHGRKSFAGKVLMLGAPKSPRPPVPDVVDMEVIETERMKFPEWYVANPGRAEDLAMIMFTAGRNDEPRAARITNRRWALAAYGGAAAASLSEKDTVYACTPLHHASGMLVAAGGALVGGARLALAPRFSAERFWPEVRRYGVTVVFYAGDMLRELVDAPGSRGEHQHPIRLFAGSGMRADIWRRLLGRFATAGVLEFYASTEGTGVLANVSGEKIGALGRPLPGSNAMLLAAYDFDQKRFVRDAQGLCVAAGDDEPSVLLTRVDVKNAQTTFDGYVDEDETQRRLCHDARARGDNWFVTGDVMRRDAQGDYWYLDRLSDVVRTPQGPVFTRPVEDALYELSEVRLVVVHASDDKDGEQRPIAAVVLREGRKLEPDVLTRHLQRRLEPHARPSLVRFVASISMSDGYRPLKRPLQRASSAPAVLASYAYDDDHHAYVPVTPATPFPARARNRAEA